MLAGCLRQREALRDGEQIAQQIRRTVKKELGLTVSIGVSYNKVFAKLGSDYKKPDAVTVFGREQMESVIWKLPARPCCLWAHTGKTLEKFGIHTIGDIARMELPAMRRMLGRAGEALWTYANGLDTSPVAAAGAAEPPKTIGNSTTLPHDVTSEEEVRRTLLELAESVASRLRHQGMKAGEVQLTVKSGDFQEYQRQCRLEPAVCDARSLYRAALELYRKEDRRWSVRLLGLRAGKLVEASGAQLSFLTEPRAWNGKSGWRPRGCPAGTLRRGKRAPRHHAGKQKTGRRSEARPASDGWTKAVL